MNEEVLYKIENNNSSDLIEHNKIILSFYECLKIIWVSEISEININDDINSNYRVNYMNIHFFENI